MVASSAASPTVHGLAAAPRAPGGFDFSTLDLWNCPGMPGDIEKLLAEIDTDKWALYDPMEGQPCKAFACTNLAAHGNFNFCAGCRQGPWWPVRKQTGHLLLGLQFMRHRQSDGHRCCCGKATCSGIGYGKLFKLPSPGSALRAEWLLAAGLTPSAVTTQKPGLAYWHFHPEHRYQDENGAWQLKRDSPAWKDDENKQWSGAVPIAKLSVFVETCRCHRPTPIQRGMLATPSSAAAGSPIAPGTAIDRATALTAVAARATGPDASRWRAQEEVLLREQASAAVSAEEQLHAVAAASVEHETVAASSIEDLQAQVAKLLSENASLKTQNQEQAQRVTELTSAADQIMGGLRYGHLHTDPAWKKRVGLFTWFKSVESNDAFLAAINLKHNAEDPGICTRLKLYQQTTTAERHDRRVPDPGDPRGRKRALDWKSQYLLFCMYVHAGFSQMQLAVIFKLSGAGLVSDYITTWAVFLDRTMAKVFPNPTKSQILRCYPNNLLAKFGHAKIVSLMDCTDQAMETPNFRGAHSALWSTYHHQPGAKFLVACTPLGTVPASWIPDAYPSSISDPKIVAATKLIETTHRFGDMTEVDKGFLIENHCIRFGVLVMRPSTMRNHQAQQSMADSALIHKVGNTRIIIEQVNEQGKTENRYFARPTPISQTTLVSHLMRICFCMANFKVPYIHGRREASTGGRPCRAANVWGGASAGALTFDARPDINLWGSTTMKQIHASLKARYFPTNCSIDQLTVISEMILTVGETMIGLEGAKAKGAWEAVKTAVENAGRTMGRPRMERAMDTAVTQFLSSQDRNLRQRR